MKQELENSTPDVQREETYEAPRVEVIELETERPILTGSNEHWGGREW